MRVPFNRTFGQQPPVIRDRMAGEAPWKATRPMVPLEPVVDYDHPGSDLDVEDQMAAAHKEDSQAFAKARQALADGAVSIDTPVFEPKGKT